MTPGILIVEILIAPTSLARSPSEKEASVLRRSKLGKLKEAWLPLVIGEVFLVLVLNTNNRSGLSRRLRLFFVPP